MTLRRYRHSEELTDALRNHRNRLNIYIRTPEAVGVYSLVQTVPKSTLLQILAGKTMYPPDKVRVLAAPFHDFTCPVPASVHLGRSGEETQGAGGDVPRLVISCEAKRYLASKT